jgi:hypothetical protein
MFWLMLCHNDMFCLLNLILKFLGWQVSKNCMLMTHILLHHTPNVLMVIKFRISRILIPIVFNLFIKVLLLCPCCQSCSLIIRSSKRFNRAVRLMSIQATDASIVPSLVSVASCVASNTPIFSFVTYTSLSIPSVCFFTTHTKA